MAFRALSRRTVLRSSAATLALPWLEAMQPALRAAAPAAAPQRLLCVFQPNGVYPKAWDVQGRGADYQISPILEPLEPLRQEVSILSHLDNVTAGNHVRMTSAFLTGRGVDNGRCPVSLDQLVAAEIGGSTLLPSLELGTEPPRQGGDGKSPIAFANTVSWSPDGQRISPEINPRVAFDRLFRTRTSPEARAAAAARTSVLDLVLGEAKSLRLKVSESDRSKLDEYLESVRSLEVRMERSLTAAPLQDSAASVPGLSRPAAGLPRERDEHLRMMMELMVLALQTDSTRVGTLMTAHGFSRQSFTFLDGVTSDHHGMSHHKNQPQAIREYTTVSRWYIEQFAWLLQRMKSIQEGDSTLLDNSIVLYGSGMKDGNGHRRENLPILLAGSGGGKLRTGQHFVLREHTPLASLHLTLAHCFGLPLEHFNNASRSEVSEILA